MPWSWECVVRHTTTTDTQPHTTTHTNTHTTKHTNNTPTHTHTHTALRERANMSGPERWWTVPDKGICSWSLGTILTCKSFVTFRSACFPQDRWSWPIFIRYCEWLEESATCCSRLHPNFKMGRVPHSGESMVNCHFSKIMNLIKATIEPAPWGTPCQSKRCSERLFEKDQTRICINVGQMGRRFTKKRRPKWPMDGLIDRIAKIDISHIATAEQRGRYQNLLYLRAFGEDLNGPPSASRPGYQEPKNVRKVSRNSDEKMLESDSSQQVPGSDWMINFILTQKGFLQWS